MIKPTLHAKEDTWMNMNCKILPEYQKTVNLDQGFSWPILMTMFMVKLFTVKLVIYLIPEAHCTSPVVSVPQFKERNQIKSCLGNWLST